MIRTTFCIDASHPALPGHFPGHPIVPGVVLLDHLAACIESEWRAQLRGLPQVKFLRPLLPGEPAQMSVEREHPVGRFVIECKAEIVAKGTFEVAA